MEPGGIYHKSIWQGSYPISENESSWTKTVQKNKEYFYGYYFLGEMEEIHLFTYDREEAKEIIKKAVGENYGDYIYVKFHQESSIHDSHLINAAKYIEDYRDELELVGYGTNYENGAKYLYVNGFDMTEEKKDYIRYITDFNYIDFGSFDKDTYFTYNDDSKEEIDEGSSYKTTYFMDIETGKITSPQNDSFEYSIVSKPYYNENNVLMVPVNGIFDLSGADVSYDDLFKTFTAEFDDGRVEISKKYIKAGDVNRKLITDAVFKNDICYISINDAVSFVTYDKTSNVLYWYGERGFQNIKSDIEEMGIDTCIFKLGSRNFMFNNKELTIDAPVYNKDGYLMVPVRALFEVADTFAQVNWNESTKKVVVNACGVEIEFMTETNRLFIDNKELYMTGSLDIKNGRLFVPLRMLQSTGILSEYDYYWNSSSEEAIIRL